MNPKDKVSEKQKRLDPAIVIPGATLTQGMLKDALTALGSTDRKISIGIDNESGFDWERPTHYFYSGTSEKNLPFHLKSGDAVLYTARKTSGSVRGAVGVVAYNVPWVRRTVAVMFSVPYDYGLFENWWNVKLYNGIKRADYEIFKDMYYDANPFQANGWHERDLGIICKFRGAMSSSGQATLEIYVTRKFATDI
ncbi:PREDICTED: DELTA-actitoxin-Ate1a-like [Acropora digitifera]|uniref:DELTA-actitoxin-Ate1a-like n=1 Tax=Acropora digitifera TaxID=70779 RepID=UPI00077A89BA|nr:PREDICTED: DELTA-actitoxin-Ate1a-like [Acropora digitifera]